MREMEEGAKIGREKWKGGYVEGERSRKKHCGVRIEPVNTTAIRYFLILLENFAGYELNSSTLLSYLHCFYCGLYNYLSEHIVELF